MSFEKNFVPAKIQKKESAENFLPITQKETYTDDSFDDLLNQLSELGLVEMREKLEDQLLDDVYERKIMTMADACCYVENLIQKRKNALEFLRAGLSSQEKDRDVIKARLRMVYDIDASTADQELFLGSGNIARVYKLAHQPGLCVKKVINDVSYARENSVSQEARFLNELSGFEVAGVRTPFVKETISGGDLTVIVMEELDAVNFELAARGKAPLPPNFDINDFFDRLKKYISALHEQKQIFHNDLAPRNIMICKKTGMPFVIDFGKSAYADDVKNADMARDMDLAGIEASRSMMRQFLDANSGVGK